MKKVTKDVIKSCADNLLFSISDEEVDVLVNDFDAVMSQVDYLSQIENIDNVTPMTFPNMEKTSFLREDEVKDVLSVKDATKNAKNKFADQIVVSKVIGGDE